MNKLKKLKLYCFSPPVMLATLAIELVLALYTFWRYKLNAVTRIAMALLDVMNPDTGEFWADPRRKVAVDKLPAATPKLNTTIGVIATNAPITKAQAKRLAMVAHDGIARAIHPAHSPLDGDTLFCLSTDDGTGVELEIMLSLSTCAAEITAAAIVDAVVAAKPGFGLNTYFELTR